MSSNPLIIEAVLTHIFSTYPHPYTRVADVACGIGKWGLLLRMHFQKLYIIGVDLSINNLSKAKMTKAYDDLIIADARQLPFRDSILDFTMACEIIEHLTKNDGTRMVSELERVTRVKILLTTPYAKWWHTEDWVRRGHITRYHPRELRKFGFKVRGIDSNIQSKGKLFSLFKHFILKPLAYVIPEIGAFLVATKRIKTFKL